MAAGGGPEVSTVRPSHRCTTIAATLLLLAFAAAAALAYNAAPAHAFINFQHASANTCASCHPNGIATPPTDANCTACHPGFKSVPGRQCWSCHTPGQPTATLSSPASACSQGCHLFDESLKLYNTDFTHSEAPHLGASGFGKTCLDCHGTSASAFNPAASPHHAGQTLAAPSCADCHNGTLATAQVSHDGVGCSDCHGATMAPPETPEACYACHAQKTFGTADCVTCHATAIHNAKPSAPACATCHQGFQSHAGKLTCTKCHSNFAGLHHSTASVSSVKTKTCRACHAKKHAGRAVPNSKCSACHKGKAPASRPAAQHSSTITKARVCSACHSKALHAKSFGARLTCRSCHTAKYHGAQPRPGNSVCTRCHTAARNHAVGFACFVCHARAIHKSRPAA
jgi:hypothetical protein